MAGLLSACGGGDSGSSSSSTAAAAGPNAVSLSWLPPTENTNGSALTDLTGYTIYYGTQSQNYTSQIQVTNPGLTTYVVDNLPPGTYYFAVTATASNGLQSGYSPEVTATVD
ncbi:MAG TPA: fibronectin type III domain-containing protein [Steroidobacteraceae bacterium]|nr:fibronectin type III domain-containing protein [Steroidobacteraceae bacterium]